MNIKLNIYYICLRFIIKYKQNLLNLTINIWKILCYFSKANKIVLEIEIAIIKKLKIIFTNSEV